MAWTASRCSETSRGGIRIGLTQQRLAGSRSRFQLRQMRPLSPKPDPRIVTPARCLRSPSKRDLSSRPFLHLKSPRRRPILAPQDPPHGLDAELELSRERARVMRVGRSQVERTHRVHRFARHLVRRVPPIAARDRQTLPQSALSRAPWLLGLELELALIAAPIVAEPGVLGLVCRRLARSSTTSSSEGESAWPR